MLDLGNLRRVWRGLWECRRLPLVGRGLRTLHVWGRMSLRTRANLRNKRWISSEHVAIRANTEQPRLQKTPALDFQHRPCPSRNFRLGLQWAVRGKPRPVPRPCLSPPPRGQHGRGWVAGSAGAAARRPGHPHRGRGAPRGETLPLGLPRERVGSTAASARRSR